MATKPKLRQETAIAPTLGINYPIDGFSRLKIPKGKEILERFFAHLRAKSKVQGQQSVSLAATHTAQELLAIWEKACVPVVSQCTVAKEIKDFYVIFSFIRNTSWESRKGYAEKVQ